MHFFKLRATNAFSVRTDVSLVDLGYSAAAAAAGWGGWHTAIAS